MSRHPLPPFQKRRAVVLWAMLAVMVLGTALVKAAHARRELIRQKLAWRVPETVGSVSGDTLTLSADGTRLICRFPAKQIRYADWIRVFDTRAGDVIEDKPASASAFARDSAPCYSMSSEPGYVDESQSATHQGTRVSLPNLIDTKPYRLQIERNGHASPLSKAPLMFSVKSSPEELRLSLDGKRLAILTCSALWHVDLNNQQVVDVVRPQKYGHWAISLDGYSDEQATLSRNGKYIVTLAPSPTLYNAHTGEKILSVGSPLETQCGGCGCIEPATGISGDEKVMWADEDGGGGNVAFWRVRDGKKLWQHVFGQWNLDPSGRYVLDVSNATLYHTATGKIVRQLSTAVDFDVYAFSRDGRQLYTLGVDGLIRRYRLP